MTTNRVLELLGELAEWAESYNWQRELVDATPNLLKLEALSVRYPVRPELPDGTDEATEAAYLDYHDELTGYLDDLVRGYR